MNVEKILLVDDEGDIRTVATLSLERIGKFRVIAAESGEEGLRKAAEEKPDLILLDMMMPGMDGLTVFGKLKENEETRGIPVVFMTAKAQESEKKEYLSRGAAGVVGKPFDPMGLPKQIREIAEGL